jgi:hypothetical protein
VKTNQFKRPRLMISRGFTVIAQMRQSGELACVVTRTLALQSEFEFPVSGEAKLPE